MKKIIILIIFFFSIISAQTDSTLSVDFKKIVLQDGQIFEGYLIKQDSLNLLLRTTDSLEIQIPKNKIKRSIIIEGKEINSIFYQRDRNSYRLLFAQTGQTLYGGEVAVNLTQIFFPYVSIGITDFAMISAGFSLFPSINNQLYYIAPKIKVFDTGQFAFSLNGLYIDNFRNNNTAVGLGYGSISFIQNKFTLTSGFGYGYSNTEFSEDPFLILGAEFIIGRNSKIIFEDWVVFGDSPNFFAMAFRVFSGLVCWDLGAVTVFSDRAYGFLPWVGIVYNFN